MMNHYGITLSAFALAVLAAGCSHSGSNLSPTSASSLSDPSRSSGSASSGSNAVSAAQQNSNAQQQNSNGEHHDDLHGVVSGLSGSCPNLAFTLDGTAVTTNSSTVFEDGPCTAIQNGTKIDVKGAKQPNGSVVASEVETENGHSKVEVEGDVSGLGGACPNLTFMVNGTAVTTNNSTDFEDGSCSGIQNNTRVEVEGLKQPDGSVLASQVEIEEVKLEGMVAGLSGVCPNLTFTVNGSPVTTNSSTKFDEGHCADVQNGEEVEVKGLRQPNGSVLARKIEVDDDHDKEVEIEGSVSALSGACPTLTFTVKGKTVVTTSLTKFDDGLCSGVQNGVKVEVKGLTQSNGSVLARKVELDDHD